LRLAREAAQMVRRSTRPRRIRFKLSQADLVTATDARVERFVRGRLATLFPGDAVVGEEGGGIDRMDLDRPTWFVDPVDGTTNYVHGIPHYACLIALWAEGRLQLGVVADVARRRTYWAEAGRGAHVGQRRIQVSRARQLTAAVLATGFPPTRSMDRDDNLGEFAAVFRGTRDTRRHGCAGIDLSWVAAGRLDGYWEQRCGPWDWAAGALLVREAGGRVSTFDGADWRPGDQELVASNGLVHDALLEAFAEARRAAGLPPRPPRP
jgi:myo-inositol-1(or 4)-monophosphatase